MWIFDASSIVYAWDNYPISQFPGLWVWLARQIESGVLTMPTVAVKEVMDKFPDCGIWLNEHQIQRLEVTNDILTIALQITALLGIKNDNYHPKGVGENDILIVATAKFHNKALVSDEAKQTKRPDLLRKCKIPFVCTFNEVAVPCSNFIEFLKQSNAIF